MKLESISVQRSRIEKTKDAYYDVLERIDYGWHEEENDPTPFIKYMLQVILACYKEFEERVGLMSEKIEVRYMMLLKIM